MNPSEISILIRKRRSVYPKSYSGGKVDNAIIEEMLENANWAPTHKLTEPWRFAVFEGAGLKKFAGFQSERYKDRTERTGNFDNAKYVKLQNNPLVCSHIIGIIMKRDPKESIPEVEEIAAVSCAVQNMWLTATAYGIGCYWSTGGVTYDEDAREFFGLEKNDRLLGFLMIGMISEPPKDSRRRPIKEKTKWIS